MNIQFQNPNATNEEKINALEKIKATYKKILLILTPISVVVSLLFLFLGTALSYKIFGVEMSYKFSELDSVKNEVAAIGASLMSFAYIPFIVALFAQAASLILVLKFPLEDKANYITLLVSAISALFALLIFIGSLYCAAGVMGIKYVEVNWSPVIFSFLVFFLNMIPWMMIVMAQTVQKQINTVKASAN